jgi:hypothetical protein
MAHSFWGYAEISLKMRNSADWEFKAWSLPGRRGTPNALLRCRRLVSSEIN